MKPSPEIEAKGMLAYEQARAFEQLQKRRLPLIYIGFSLIPLCFSFFMWRGGHRTGAELDLIVTVLVAVALWMHGRRLQKQYVQNLALLAELEKTYGEQLPWLQIEKHLAAMAKLEQEIAMEKAAGQNPSA